MAKKKPLSSFKKIAMYGVILIIVQIIYLNLFRPPKLTAREAIGDAVKGKSDLDPARREQLRIQLALSDFRTKHKKLPESLNELVPEYFDVVPNNPDNNQPYKYRIDGQRYFLGDEPTPTPAPGQAPAAPNNPDEKNALIASLGDKNQQAAFVYDPTGKRDPFRPFDFAPRMDPNSSKTPLEQYNIGQLKLTAVLAGFDEPRAIVENAAGKGFTISKGTKIGPNGGEVVEIKPDKILILETVTDFTGQAKTQTIEMKLRKPGQETEKN